MNTLIFFRGRNTGGSREGDILICIIAITISLLLAFVFLKEKFWDIPRENKIKQKLNQTKILYEQLTNLGWEVPLKHQQKGILLENAFVKKVKGRKILVHLRNGSIPEIYEFINSEMIPRKKMRLNSDTYKAMCDYVHSFK